MQIRVADSQSRTPGWVSVNAFAHLQLREGACARAPVVFSLVGTLEAATQEIAASEMEKSEIEPHDQRGAGDPAGDPLGDEGPAELAS